MEYERIFRDGINLFIGRVGTLILGLLNTMILARILTTENMGKYSLFFMIVNIALMFAFGWSESSIVRHGREEFIKYKKINRSFWARLQLVIPLIVFFTFIFIIFNGVISHYIGISNQIIIFVIVVFILSGFLSAVTRIYQSIDQIRKSSYVLFSQKLFYFIFLLFIFFNVFSSNIFIILLFINISFLLSLILFSVKLDFSVLKPRKFYKSYLKKIWSYSWPQLIGFSGLYAVNYIDLYVIRNFMTLSDVGVYSIAYKGFEILIGSILIINTLFMPLIVEYKTQKNYDKIKKYLQKIPLFFLAWIFIVIIGLISSKYFVTLAFSEKYIEAIPSFNILLITTLFYFISICLLPIFNAFDFVLQVQIFNLIKAAINIISDFILVPKLGIIGGAYGTLLSYFIGLILSLILFKSKIKIITGDNIA